MTDQQPAATRPQRTEPPARWLRDAVAPFGHGRQVVWVEDFRLRRIEMTPGQLLAYLRKLKITTSYLPRYHAAGDVWAFTRLRK